MRKLIVIFLLTVGIPLHLSLLATTVLAQELSDDDSEFYDFEDDDFDDFTDLGDVKNVEPSDFEAAPKHAEVEKAAPEEENLISERPTADLEKIQPGIAYAKFDYKPSPWRIYVDYGYQFANVEKTFTSSIPLPITH